MKKSVTDTRAAQVGNVSSGQKEYAFATTRTHTSWDTSALTAGVNNRLSVSLDQGTAVQVVPVTITATLTVEVLADLINTAFVGVGTPALQVHGGYLRIRSLLEGHECSVDLTGSDQALLDILKFDRLEAVGRQIEDTARNLGTESNPVGTKAPGSGEPQTTETLGRSLVSLATSLDLLAAQTVRDFANPYQATVEAADELTMDDLGAPRSLQLNSISTAPVVGEVLTGGSTGHTARVVNVVSLEGNDATALVHSATGVFSPGEAFSGSGGAAGNVATEAVLDTRVAAIRLPENAYVGGVDLFGGTVGDGLDPTPEQLADLFYLEVSTTSEDKPARGTPVTGFVGVTEEVFSAQIPHQRTDIVRARHVCAGQPDDAYEPTNTYNHEGILRMAAVNIDGWTRNKVYPTGGTVANVEEGDILTITGSASGGVALNDGSYVIYAIGEDDTGQYYQIGPSATALTSLGLPEEVEADSQLYPDNTTVGVQVSVSSPSYALSDRDDSTATNRRGWLLLETPVDTEYVVTLHCFVVITKPELSLGRPMAPFIQVRHLRARLQELESALSILQPESIFSGTVVPGRKGAATHTSKTQWTARVDADTARADHEILHQQFLPQRAVAAGFVNELGAGRRSPAAATSLFGRLPQEAKDGVIAPVSPIVQAQDRVVRNEIQLFEYTPYVGTPSPGNVLVGAASSCRIEVLAKQTGNAFLGIVIPQSDKSQVPMAGENLTGGGVTVNDLVIGNSMGFNLALPRSDRDGSGSFGGTVPKGSQTVTIASASPTYWDNIRKGDVFQVQGNGLLPTGFSSRISEVLSTTELFLQTENPSSSGTSPFNWRVTPDLGSHIQLSGDTCDVVERSGFLLLTIGADEDGPQEQGVLPGDFIFSGLNTSDEWLTIKRLIPMPSGSSYALVEVEESDRVVNSGTLGWRIRTAHGKVRYDGEAFGTYIDNDDRNIDTYRRPVHWNVKGSAYVWIPSRAYDSAANKGGPVGGAVTGFNYAGLNGKEMTVSLYSNGTLLASKTLTFASDPATIGALANEINTQIGATTWFGVTLGYGQRGLAFYTTEGGDAGAGVAAGAGIGPGVSLDIQGEAWDVLISGASGVEFGNVSGVVQAEAVAESFCWVKTLDNAVTSTWKFPWEGRADLILPQVALGGDEAVSGDRAEAAGSAVLLLRTRTPLPSSTVQCKITPTGSKWPRMPSRRSTWRRRDGLISLTSLCWSVVPMTTKPLD